MSASEYLIQKLFDEDKDFIKGARIDKILKVNNKNVAFVIFNKKQSKTLLLSLDPLLPICLLGNSLVSFTEENNGFFLQLKKYLEYGTIVDFIKVENDRIIKFVIKKRLPTYIYQKTTLVFEMIPMRANMLLLDEFDKIIDAFHKSDGFEGEHIILKGLKYEHNLISSKKINLTDSLEDIRFKVSRKEFAYLSSLTDVEFSNIKNNLDNLNTFYLANNDLSLFPLEGAIILEKEDLLSSLIKKHEEDGRKNHYKSIIDLVNKKCSSLNRKINKLYSDLKTCENASNYKDLGTLLYYGSSTYKKGDSEVIIEGVLIPLSKELDLNQNASMYFKKYKKAVLGIKKINEQIEITKKELSYFEEIKTQIEYAKDDDYKQILMQLENDHYLKSQHKNQKKKEVKVFNPHIITYNNIKIGYGLSSFQNDYLTFTLAHKEDIFMHIKNYHGPHVIIFNDSPSEDTLLFGAEVSLFFASKTAGDVLYAKRKDIKKIPAKTGMVELNIHKEIHIVQIREETLSILRKLK